MGAGAGRVQEGQHQSSFSALSREHPLAPSEQLRGPSEGKWVLLSMELESSRGTWGVKGLPGVSRGCLWSLAQAEGRSRSQPDKRTRFLRGRAARLCRQHPPQARSWTTDC